MYYNNGDLSLKNLKEKVELRGFVSKKRALGGLLFVDLRDMYGITQIVFKPENKKIYELAKTLGNEDVIEIKGIVVKRESINLNLKTGKIEVLASSLIIHSKAETTPLIIADKTDALEEIRLKYRYLDLRRPVQKNYIIKRSEIIQSFREALLKEKFLELDTPILSKSTPEGARDYLVPSRLYQGQFYALPQSPQIYKQLFMIAGFDKYFQIAKCLRDEDLRADRQPEFSQVDIEMSFATEEKIFKLSEKIFKYVFKKILNQNLKTPFLRMSYDDAIKDYGTDRPDLRFDMKIIDKTEFFKNSNINFLKDKDAINLIIFNDKENQITRKKVDDLTLFVKKYKASGLAWFKYTKTEITGSIAKLVDQNILATLNLKENDVVFIIADNYKISKTALGALRNKLAQDFNLYKKDDYKFLWVYDFPLFELNDEGNITSSHHPFTMPKGNLDTDDLLSLKSSAYDLVLNGYELSSGSIRIHNQKTQRKIFEILKLTNEEINNRFGFFIEAFKYGVPPHGGIAFGVERTVMLLTQTDNIKDVVSFPKTQSARDLMNDSPSYVSNVQLKELGLKIEK